MSKKRKSINPVESAGNRRSREYLLWRRAVLMQGGFECDVCGHTSFSGKGLVAHHLSPYYEEQEELAPGEGGVVLCTEHHKLFHKQYSYTSFSEENYEQFKFKYKGTLK